MQIFFKKKTGSLAIMAWMIAIAVFVIIVIGTIPVLTKEGKNLIDSFKFDSKIEEKNEQSQFKTGIESQAILFNQNKNEEQIRVLEELVENTEIPSEKKIDSVYDLILKYETESNAQKMEQLILLLEKQKFFPEKLAEYKFRLLILYNNINNLNNDNNFNLKIKSLSEELQEQYENTIYAKLSLFYLGQFYEKEATVSGQIESSELIQKARAYFTKYAAKVTSYTLTEEGRKHSNNIITNFITLHPVEEAIFLEARIISKSKPEEALEIYSKLATETEAERKNNPNERYFINAAAIEYILLDQLQVKQTKFEIKQSYLTVALKDLNEITSRMLDENQINQRTIFLLTKARLLQAQFYEYTFSYSDAVETYEDIIHNTPHTIINEKSINKNNNQIFIEQYDQNYFSQTIEAKQAILKLFELYADKNALNNKQEAGKIYKQIKEQYKDDKDLLKKAVNIAKKWNI